MTNSWSPREVVAREGGVIVPGSGGRHRRFREPSLALLVMRRLLAEARGMLR
ncbi:MAG: hypothetical protein ACRDSN_10150 [Pseudonocardiaceae bacterium]